MESDSAPKRLRSESYEQKLEHRAAKHECLRDRNNVTSCRSPGTPQESEWKSNMRRKRQEQFQKRRQISSEAARTDAGPKEKVTLRDSRRKVPLIHRQSLVTSQDLGITWPDISTLEQASWMPSANTNQDHNMGRTSSSPDRPSSLSSLQEAKGPQRRSVGTCEGVQSNQRSRLIRMRDFSSQTECGCVSIKEEDLIQLGEYLKEALWREEALKKKLALLQQETLNLLTYCDQVWKVHFKEDLMKCKIGALESQLQMCIQRFSKDEGKRLLMLMEEQFQLEEERTVASLQRMTAEKAQALESVRSLERAVERAQEESHHWRQLHEEQTSLSAQLRVTLQQSTDQILTLQSQIEKSAVHEALLQKQLQQLQDQHASFLEPSQQGAHEQGLSKDPDQDSSTGPVAVSPDHRPSCSSIGQAHPHSGRQNTMETAEPSASEHNSQAGLTAQHGPARQHQGVALHHSSWFVAVPSGPVPGCHDILVVPSPNEQRGAGGALPDHGGLCRKMHTGSDLIGVSKVL